MSAPAQDARGLRVALTGGIASGKTAVADRFAALGVPVVDTDLLAREVVLPGSDGLAAVIEAFGDAVLAGDGTLDRAAMRTRIFSEPAARHTLESILHPRIHALTEQRCVDAEQARAPHDPPYVIAVIPLLVEGGRLDRFERILVVDCDTETQLARVAARDGETRQSAQRILAAQATREQRLAAATEVIRNDDTLQVLDQRVTRMHGHYLAQGLAFGDGLPTGAGWSTNTP